GIALLENMQFGIASQSHFFSSEIQSQALFIACPLASSHVVAFSVNSYGIKKVSNLLTLRGVYTKRFGHLVSGAISVNGHRYHVTNYQDDKTFSLDLGFQYYVSDYITVGAFTRNVTKSKYQDNILQYIPAEFGIGFCYVLSRELRLACDTYYDKYKALDCRGGVEYAVDAKIFIRGGIATLPMQYFGGVGLTLDKLHVDIASSFH